MRAQVNKQNKRRIAIGFVLLAILMLALTFVLAKIMIIKSDFYTEKAISQQTKDQIVEAKRGVIYDRNGKELATTTTCYTFYARPSTIQENYKLTEIKVMAQDICQILTDLDPDGLTEKLTSETSALVTVAKYLDKDTVTAIRALEYKGFEFTEGTKRYYPLGNFASQVLGSVTDENTGRTGIELQYDQYLSGVAGRWVKNTDISGNELVDGTEEYYAAQDGLSVVLTIDEAIQYYAEKAINKALNTYKAKRVMCLIMNPKTGEVLASAVTPGYDPNDPYTPATAAQKEEYKALETTEAKNNYLFKLWRNPIVSDTYEPGSTFKLITSSSAIEEKAISLDETFYCSGSFNVADYTLHCAGRAAHGMQTIERAVGNSCNSALAAVARKMGKTAFYKYLDLYGITEKTGIDYPGEATAIVQSLSNVGPVELATIGYGQGISVTPIQLLTAINTIGNDGVLLQPRYVKALVDSEGKIVKEFETTEVRRVISESTADEMKEIMEYVVSKGGGGTAKIPGYRIGGKTGTANKVENGAYGSFYYSSFVGMAPMDDPQISILVVIDSSRTAIYGSVVAAPVAKEILSDVLRYLNISPEYSEAEKKAYNSEYTTVPNVTGCVFENAVGILAGRDLKYSRTGTAKDDEEFTVVDQYPKAGTTVKKNTKVYLYKE